ncbi:histidine kinase [Herbivorax sp. ANBcel31]|uniref:sensor histidine kinase n=1 Tax=Herbivorax sp. ANBcel31 TaxID=3069754 RepID=UPI0027B58834|nr:histidine kinase [Herbivorax sp. ANBcel31]MDQ2086062.1 histidine kinase [Herbivorax sp. ANBcel31]
MSYKIKEIAKWFNCKKLREKLLIIFIQLIVVQAIVVFATYLMLQKNSDQMMIYILASTIIYIIFSCITGTFIYMHIVKPIEKLIQYIDIPKSKKNSEPNKEMKNKIEKHIMDTTKLIEVDKIINELLYREREIKRAEMEVLQERINPHFLYNALGTIANLALENSDEKTYDAIEALGNFYRKFLSGGNKEVSLKEEIEMVKNYLKIQKLRYEDVFEDKYEIDENLLNIVVPKLFLQPLVENSLYHGVRLKEGRGTIKISVYQKEEKIHIVVFDTGVGMSEKHLKQIMDKGGKNGFGLKSTIERIQYYYSTSDVYEITTKEGFYFKIDIKIPM